MFSTNLQKDIFEKICIRKVSKEFLHEWQEMAGRGCKKTICKVTIIYVYLKEKRKKKLLNLL